MPDTSYTSNVRGIGNGHCWICFAIYRDVCLIRCITSGQEGWGLDGLRREFLKTRYFCLECMESLWDDMQRTLAQTTRGYNCLYWVQKVFLRINMTTCWSHRIGSHLTRPKAIPVNRNSTDAVCNWWRRAPIVIPGLGLTMPCQWPGSANRRRVSNDR